MRLALTTNIDTINVDGHAVNTVYGVQQDAGSTWNSGDVINGNNKTIIALTANGDVGGTTASVVDANNIAAINANLVQDTTLNAVEFTNVAAVNVSNGIAATTLDVTNATLGTTYGINVARAVTLDVNDWAGATGTADTALLSVAGAGLKATAGNRATIDASGTGAQVEAVTLSTSGTNYVDVYAGTAAKTITVTGNGTNDIGISSAPAGAVYTLDASATTGTNVLSLGDNFSANTVVKGGSGVDTLKANISTTAQYSSTVTGVEKATLTFAAAGTYDASKTTGLEELTVVPTANVRAINLNAATDLIKIGTTAAISNSSDSLFQYATGSESDVVVSIGATPTTGTAAVDTGDVTVSRNTGSVTIQSNGSKANLIDAVAADNASALTIKGDTQALTTTTVSAAKAATVNYDATLKNTTVTTSSLTDYATAVNLTAGAGVLQYGLITQTAAALADIDAVYTIASGAKGITSGAGGVALVGSDDGSVAGQFDITDGAGATATGALSAALNVAAGQAGDLSLIVNATAADAGITIADVLVQDRGTTGSSGAILNLTTTGGDITLTDLSLVAVDSASVNATVGEGDLVTVNILSADTGILSSVLATGNGNFTLAGAPYLGSATDAITVNTAALKGDVAINLSSALGAVTATLGSDTLGTLGTIALTTGGGADYVTIGGTAATVVTGAAADTVIGGAGADSITGGDGADRLTGGAGANDFTQGTTSSVDATATTVVIDGTATYGGKTMTFGDGVDIITDFVSGTDDLATTVADSVTAIVNTTVAANLAAATNYYAIGTYVGGVFTFNSAATASTANVATLVVADSVGGAIAAEDGMVILLGIAGVVAGDFIA